ncbi:Oxidoreductase [Serendipita sp. 405]|nr:Oxidoreductase [Serendipita sp. 405]
MSGFLRSLGTRLQASRPARYGFYGATAAGTSYIVWKLNEKGRERRRNALSHAHAKTHASHGSDSRVSTKPEIPPVPSSIPTDSTPAKVVVENKAGEIQEADEATNIEGRTEGVDGDNTGAFNPETGEINWDCPCLGGMAHGPCGPQFRVAFSCFVFSEDEPKGINCVENFRDMQDCFRAHPEVYAEELADDGDEPTDINERDPPSHSSTPDSTDGVPPPTGGEGLEIPDAPSDPTPPPENIKIPESPPPLPPAPAPKPIPPPPETGRTSPPGFAGGRRHPVPIDPRPRPPTPIIVDPPASGPLDGAGGIASTKSSEKPDDSI